MTPPPMTYTLTVNSTNPATNVAITVTPSDNNSAGNGTTSFSRTYSSGTAVTLTAPSTVGGSKFSSWSGCTTANTVTCSLTMNANATVSANYAASPITSVTIKPSPTTAIIGTTVQFSATVTGTGTFDSTVTWSVLGPPGSTLSAGEISSTGLYTTPYPAPSSVTVVATSNQDSTMSGSSVVTLTPPSTVAGPSLTVDAGNQTHAISPLIYGMNFYTLNPDAAKAARLSADRWGGDATSRYNYLLDVTNSASDWYFENSVGATGVEATGAFNAQVTSDEAIGAKTIGTVPVQGWVAKNGTACSFPATTYPNQYAFDPSGRCGDGELSNQTNITGNDPTVTSTTGRPFVGRQLGGVSGEQVRHRGKRGSGHL